MIRMLPMLRFRLDGLTVVYKSLLDKANFLAVVKALSDPVLGEPEVEEDGDTPKVASRQPGALPPADLDSGAKLRVLIRDLK